MTDILVLLIKIFCCEICAYHSGVVDLRLVEYDSTSTAPRRLFDLPINQHSKLKNANIKSCNYIARRGE